MNHRNLNSPLTYPPVLPERTLEEFYGVDGPVPQTFDFHTRFPQMFGDDVEAARVCIVSDSCYPIDAIGSLVHGDTRTMSMPRSTYSEMARVLNTFCIAGTNVKVALLVGGLDFIRRTLPDYDFNNGEVPTDAMIKEILLAFTEEVKEIQRYMKARNLPEKVVLAAPPGLGSRDGNLQAIFHMFATVSDGHGLSLGW